MSDNVSNSLPTHSRVVVNKAADIKQQAEAAKPIAASIVSSNIEKSAFMGGGSSFVTPRIFDPGRYKNTGYRGYGVNNYLNLDFDKESRNNLYDGIEVIMKTNPVMNACHTAGTKVDVDGSLIPIEHVSIGDMVRTHMGEYHEVSEVFELPYAGELYTFSTHKSNAEVECTSGHPLYVYRDGSYGWVDASDIKKGDYLVSPVFNDVADIASIKCKKETTWTQFEYVDPRKDKVVEAHDITRISELEIPASASLFRLVGYHLSDGCVSTNRVSLFFGGHEQEYVDDVFDICQDVLGIEPKINNEQDKNMIKVCINSAPFSEWLLSEFGCGAHNKRIPLWVQKLPKEKQFELLVGFFRGDGNSTKNEIRFDTVSDNLIHGLSTIALRCGFETCLQWTKPCDFYRTIGKNKKPSHITKKIGTLRLSGESARKFKDAIGEEYYQTSKPYSLRSLGFFENGYMHYAVKSVSKKRFIGTVYNLEVNKDHSYLANGFASHNCREVYTRYPLAGIHLECKDEGVQKFFEEIFLETLDYQDLFLDVGKSFWSYADLFLNGVWDDSLGMWVDEDLLDPRMVEVVQVPMSKENVLVLEPDDGLKKAARGVDVAGRIFQAENPELAQIIREGRDIILSPDRCIHLSNKNDRNDLRGTPVALRAWNTLRLMERLDSAMLATADRLYAPLLLFSLGGQLADGTAYIPSPKAVSAFKSQLDTAMSSDFRALITNQFVSVQEVIRGDKMSNFKSDIDMYDDRLFLAWGLSSSILKPTSGPYATSAMNFELAGQMLSTYQNKLIEIYTRRAAFIAEAHGIYDYELKGTQKDYKKEYKKVWSDEANDGQGGYVIRETNKLLIPDMKMNTINFNSDEKIRDFLTQLRNEGLPISNEDRIYGVDIDLEASEEKARQEQIHSQVQEAKAHTAIYMTCIRQGIVVPPATKEYMEKGLPPADQKKLLDAISQNDDDFDDDSWWQNDSDTLELGLSIPSDTDDDSGDDDSSYGDGARPDISDERREDMPKRSKKAHKAPEASKTVFENRVGSLRGVDDMGKLSLKVDGVESAKARTAILNKIIETDEFVVSAEQG